METFLYALAAVATAVGCAFAFVDRSSDERGVSFTGLFCVIGGLVWPLTLVGFVIVGLGFTLGTIVLALKDTLDIGQKPKSL